MRRLVGILLSFMLIVAGVIQAYAYADDVVVIIRNGGSSDNEKTPTVPVSKTLKFDIPFKFNVTDAIMDSSNKYMYVSDRGDSRIYRINLLNKKIDKIDLENAPQNMYLQGNKLYVASCKQAFNSNRDDKDQAGTVSIIDCGTLKVENSFDVDIDPFNIVVSKTGYIFISSGSGQHTVMNSYSLDTTQQVASTGIYAKTYITYNPRNNKIYGNCQDISPRSYSGYTIKDDGTFGEPSYPGGYDSPYHGDYPVGKWTVLSPDGRYLFNSAGVVYKSASSQEDDMKYVTSLNKAFTDVAFDGTNRFFSIVSADLIYQYKYDDESFKGTGSYKTGGGQALRVFYSKGNLYVIIKNGAQYGLKILKTK